MTATDQNWSLFSDCSALNKALEQWKISEQPVDLTGRADIWSQMPPPHFVPFQPQYAPAPKRLYQPPVSQHGNHHMLQSPLWSSPPGSSLKSPLSSPPPPVHAHEAALPHAPTKREPSPVKLKLFFSKFKPDCYKTELCRSWVNTGTCKYGDKCSYAHGRSELRPKKRNQAFKTQPCTDAATHFHCGYAHRCNYVHPGEAVRRPTLLPYFDSEYESSVRATFGDMEFPYGVFL